MKASGIVPDIAFPAAKCKAKEALRRSIWVHNLRNPKTHERKSKYQPKSENAGNKKAEVVKASSTNTTEHRFAASSKLPKQTPARSVFEIAEYRRHAHEKERNKHKFNLINQNQKATSFVYIRVVPCIISHKTFAHPFLIRLLAFTTTGTARMEHDLTTGLR